MFCMKTIGEKAKEFRLSKGWNTTRMGKEVGTSRQNIEKLEEVGNRKPSYILSLARVMGVTVDDLMNEATITSAYFVNEFMPDGGLLSHVVLEERRKSKPDELVIPQFATGGSMGGGLVLRDQPGVIKGWSVNKEWVSKNVKQHSSDDNLCIVTGFGDSMKGMFNPGDPLLVDAGVRSVEFDAVYFFRVEDEGFIKRLQRIPGEGIRVLSENKKYESWTIKQGMNFEVFGRVLKAWQGEEF